MSPSNFSFELITQDENARLGKITTPKGCIDTPTFMPVGTQGTVNSFLFRVGVKRDLLISGFIPISAPLRCAYIAFWGLVGCLPEIVAGSEIAPGAGSLESVVGRSAQKRAFGRSDQDF